MEERRASRRDFVGLPHIDQDRAVLLQGMGLSGGELGNGTPELDETLFFTAHDTPPATAGTIERTSPSPTGDFNPTRERMLRSPM